MPHKQIIIVQGPTASGKTSLALALARHYQTEIISFDSRQFYTELAIGVARPTSFELSQVKHHFIATETIHAPLNAATYAQRAKPILDQLLHENGFAVLVGGSALFADALLLGLDPLPHDAKVHLKWQEAYQHSGIERLQEALRGMDPAFYEQIDQHNPARLIRALEVAELTGGSNLALRKGPKADPSNVQRFFIDWPRTELYNRIDQRVDQMHEEGLRKEALQFYPQSAHLQALQTVGYQEFFACFSGLHSEVEALAKIKQHTRNYAKRQLTWLRRYQTIHALDPNSTVSLLDQALLQLG
ncbi:MAG: tRNA (adenosine(37)-N6)-dimethylallyltransferase MiaA [Flavobacteriales bacterium]